MNSLERRIRNYEAAMFMAFDFALSAELEGNDDLMAEAIRYLEWYGEGLAMCLTGKWTPNWVLGYFNTPEWDALRGTPSPYIAINGPAT
jgi:hypothetical protein